MKTIDIDEMKEQARRTKMLHEFCKDHQIEMRIKAWIKSNGPNIRPPILFDIEKDRWFWVNRDQRKRIQKQERKDAKKNSSKSELVGLDGQPLSERRAVPDEIFNTLTRVSKGATTGNNEGTNQAPFSFEGESYDTQTGVKTPCREVTEIDRPRLGGPRHVVESQGQEGTDVSEASGQCDEAATTNL